MAANNHVRPLSAELSAYAHNNCKESADVMKSSLDALQSWIKKSRHLKARNDPQLLLSFLRRCQFSLMDSKNRIACYYSMKAVFPEVLSARTVNDATMQLHRTGIHIIPLNPISAAGPRVIISQFAKCDMPPEAFKLLFMLLEILAIEDDNASVVGIVYVLDARDASVEHMLQYDLFLIKKLWMLVDRCMPLRFNEIHVINMRREGQAVFNFITTMLPSKLPFKFKVHQKAEDLYEHIPRDVMPIEYGGHNGFQNESIDIWQHKLKDYASYFADDANYGSDEKLRFGAGNNGLETGELGGVEGSFRKLEVD